MFHSDTKRLALKCAALILLVFCLLTFSTESTKSLLASSNSLQDRAQLPTVSVETQSDSPLHIVDASPLILNSEKHTVRVSLQNQSGKKIRAFAIAADENGGSGGHVMFTNLAGSNSVLLPTQLRSVDFNYNHDASPKAVTLYVDFVELNDGSTWGRDLNNSRDKLAGQREGASKERQRLRSLLKTRGRSALVSAVEGNEASGIDQATDTKPSEQWRQGFQSGAQAIRRRVREALKVNDPARIELELAKPYDTSEVNP